MKSSVYAVSAALLFAVFPLRADIIRWDNNKIIPGTQSITPAPGVNLSNWNSGTRRLSFGIFDTDISSATFLNSDLSNAKFAAGADVSGAIFTNAKVQGAQFNDLTSHGFTSTQLSSTNSFLAHKLNGIQLGDDDLNAWNFSGQNLTKALFDSSDLTNVNFSNATITKANFDGSNLDAAQLSTTKNYAKHNLSNLGLSDADLSTGNFSKQNLSHSNLTQTDLDNGNFSKANLNAAIFVDGDLASANFTKSKVAKTNFSDADLRGATGFVPARNTITTNAILPDGSIHGLSLKSGEDLIIRNNPVPITVNTAVSFNQDSTLTFILLDNWTSSLGFTSGLNPAPNGTLDLEFPADIDPSSVDGHSFHLFDWNSPLPSTQFSSITTDPRLVFDLSNLYTTGIVTVSLPLGSAIPEPASIALLAPALLLFRSRRGR